MNEDFASGQFKHDLMLQTLVHETQFEQWLKFTFYLNHELTNEYDTIYQDSFYIKIYELLTEGVTYARRVNKNLEHSSNQEKKEWYRKLIKGVEEIKLNLEELEFHYIEYRRHTASHIFQNQYEHIQLESLRIKKERKGIKLEKLDRDIKDLIIKFGSDKNIDIHLNNKLQPILTKMYEELKRKTYN